MFTTFTITLFLKVMKSMEKLSGKIVIEKVMFYTFMLKKNRKNRKEKEREEVGSLF